MFTIPTLFAKLSLHPVTAAIWLYETNGKPHFSVQIERRNKDEAGNWRNTNRFGADDLPLVAKIIDMAHSEIDKFEAEERQVQLAEE
jgi:hypothetical protein